MAADTAHRAETLARTSIPTTTERLQRRGGVARGSLDQDLRNSYVAGGGWERVQARSVEHAGAMIRYLARIQKRDGDQILRSIPQIAKGLGKPVEGLSARQIRDQWEDHITAALSFLETAGYVDRVERDLRRDNGEGIGIVIHLHAGVAQLVRATVSHENRTGVRAFERRDRSSFSGTVPPPRRGTIGGTVTPSLNRTQGRDRQQRASARDRRLRDATRPPSLSTAVAALESAHQKLCLEGSESSGVRLVAAEPTLAALPLSLLARAAWQAQGHRDLRLSLHQRQQLELAGTHLERAGYAVLPSGPEAAAAAILDLAAGDWSEFWEVGDKRQADGRAPMTPGAIAICARRLAHRQLAKWRARRRRARGEAPRG